MRHPNVSSRLRVPSSAKQATSPPSWRLSRRACLALGMALLAGASGCEEPETLDAHVNPVVNTKASSQTSLQQGMDFLKRLEESNAAEAYRRIQQYLQEWLAQQPEDKDWQPDTMADRLPLNRQGGGTGELLRQRSFEMYDILSLRESLWLRDIAQASLREGRLAPGLEDLVAKTPGAAEGDLRRSLTDAAKLFDWTVLNLQTDPSPEEAPGERQRFGSNLSLYAWESLLMGRGTMEEKSRVFTLLARQLGLDVVMLALDRPEAASPVPWLPAVAVGGQLYLFDMHLGSPLPEKSGEGILTLARLIDDPSQLESLAASADQPYLVRPEDLSYVVAFLDATPADLSLRMKLLESALVGEDKMTLTANPSTLAKTLAESRGIQRVEIWPLPYAVFAQRGSLDPNSQPAVELAMEHSLFDRRPLLLLARVQHFRGNFEPTEEQSGARSLYLASRVPEEELARILETPLPQNPGGPPPDDEAKRLHAQRLVVLQSLMRRTKQNASYWLGLMAFDRGQYDVAIDYLEKRLLGLEPQTIWSSGAHHALGRAYEAKGRAENNLDALRKAHSTYLDAPPSAYTTANQWHASHLPPEARETGETP